MAKENQNYELPEWKKQLYTAGIFVGPKVLSISVGMPFSTLAITMQSKPVNTKYSTVLKELMNPINPKEVSGIKRLYKGWEITAGKFAGKEAVNGLVITDLARLSRRLYSEETLQRYSQLDFITAALLSALSGTFFDRFKAYSMTNGHPGSSLELLKNAKTNGGAKAVIKVSLRGAAISYMLGLVGTIGYHSLDQEIDYRVRKARNGAGLNAGEKTLSAIGIGCFLALVKSPLSVMSTVSMQHNSPVKNGGLLETACHVYRADGSLGFFKGLPMTLALNCISSIAYKLSMDATRHMLRIDTEAQQPHKTVSLVGTKLVGASTENSSKEKQGWILF